MAINFPDSPSVGDIYSSGANSFQWDGTAWKKLGDSYVVIADTSPGAAEPGQLWFNSDTGILSVYYDDGSSQQWVNASPGVVPSDIWVNTGSEVIYNVGNPVGVNTSGLDATADFVVGQVAHIGDTNVTTGASQLNFIGDTTYTSYGLTVRRNAGENSDSLISHRGTGELVIQTEDGGQLSLIDPEFTNTSSLGTTNGDSLEAAAVNLDTGNVDKLVFSVERVADGSLWTTARQRIQRRVDANNNGFIEFGRNDINSDPIVFGTGTNTEFARFDNNGDLVFQTPTATFSATQGIAKSYLHYQQSTNTLFVSDNVASVTDSGTGLFVTNFTNVFDSATYGFSGMGSEGSLSVNTVQRDNAQSDSSNSFFHRNTFANAGNNNVTDTNRGGASYHGDLA